MKKQVLVSLLSAGLFLSACNQTANKETESTEEASYIPLDKMNIESLNEEIAKREKALDEDSNLVNSQKAARLMEAYAVYGEKFANYPSAAERLFKAGELAMGLGHKVQAIKHFDKVYNEFKDYDKRPYALFMKAFVLENQARRYEQAKVVYEQFLREYPTHAMADDAEYSIKNMGKSPEELIQEFERQDSIRKAQEGA